MQKYQKQKYAQQYCAARLTENQFNNYVSDVYIFIFLYSYEPLC